MIGVCNLMPISFSLHRVLSKNPGVLTFRFVSDGWTRIARSRRRRQGLSKGSSYQKIPSLCLSLPTETNPVPQHIWVVKEAESEDEFLQFLKLLVKAYLEGVHQESDEALVHQVIQRESLALRGRCQVDRRTHPQSICLIAKSASEVIGGIEICLSKELSGGCPPGVPVADSCGFYIQNVAVNESYRRQGVGHMMMKEMCALCTDLNASALYTDVERENEAAVKLYLKHDFQILKSMKQPDPLRKNREVLYLKRTFSKKIS